MLVPIEVFGGTFTVLDRTHLSANSRKLQKTPLPTVDDLPLELPQAIRSLLYDELVREHTSSEYYPGRTFCLSGPTRLHADWRVSLCIKGSQIADFSLRRWAYTSLVLLAWRMEATA